jgi:hypothetical protein
MGWTREHNAPDRFNYSLKEILLRPLAEGETCVALDAWTNDQGKNELSDWTPDPALNYRVWRDGREVLNPEPGDLGEVVSERWLTRAHSSRRVPMAPGVVLGAGVVLFRTFHWDWEVVLPTGRIRVAYRAPIKVPAPLSLVELVHHEHGLAVGAADRHAIGTHHKDIEIHLRGGQTRRLARITVATDLDGSHRLYLTVKVAHDVARSRQLVADLATQEGWLYSPSGFFAAWLRGERADAGDQEGVFEAWARGGQTVFGYTGDEIRLPHG